MKNGPYELVVVPSEYPGKRYRGRYCYEHHLVWWQKTGKLVSEGEVIHHKNGDKRDNRFRNLELKKAKEHVSEHQKEKTKRVGVFVCPSCGKKFERDVRISSLARKNGKLTFCSRTCIGKYSFRSRDVSESELRKAQKANLVEIKEIPRSSIGS